MEAQHARRRRGLILGKFLPPHRGHLHLAEEAMRRCEELTILVCSLRAEPIPGALRFAWMQELVPDAKVIHVTDENPSFPDEHERFWDIWAETIRRAVPEGFDVLFTSETYGPELATRLGVEHESIDLPRTTFPVSGTAVRKDPFANWDHLPPPVRAYYARRVVLTGSESTGKSSLAPRLAQHFDTVWSREWAREYLDSKSTPLDASDIEPIARGQIAAEDAAARQANRIVLHDTDLLSTVVYARHYYGFCPEWAVDAAQTRRPDLYLLLDIDHPWQPDPQRDRGDRREEMQALFRKAVEASGAPFVEIRGSAEERLAAAIAAIRATGLTVNRQLSTANGSYT